MAKSEITHINSNEVNIEDVTPVMQQYLKIKRKNPDKLLLYRLGDFYETFFEDAETMSRELELTLTGRDAGSILGRVPLAGIPAKSVETYTEKLVSKGYKIAICEQLEDPKLTKGIVKRGVVRLITAGTVTENQFLKQANNNYICSLVKDSKSDLYGFAYADISTGEFKTTEAPYNMILSELARIQPVEIVAPAVQGKIVPFQIVPEDKIDLPEEIQSLYNCSKIPASVFESNFALNNLKNVFKTKSLESFGYTSHKLGFRAAGALVAYIWENMKGCFPKFDTISSYELSEYVLIDASTRKNLELTETLREKSKYGSLFWAIDRTKTCMGARLLKSWICQPLRNLEQIIERQDIVEKFIDNIEIRLSLIELLSKIYDIQRLSSRLSNNSANPADFLNLKDTLFLLPEINNLVKNLDVKGFNCLFEYEELLLEFAQIIDRTIKPDASITLKDGGVIKDGVNGELDYYRDLLTGGEKWLKEFEEKEKEKTGCKFLKVGYNKIFGFYIEVTNSNLNLVPANYVRKQTLTNAERFITDELKKHEDDVISAQFKVVEMEAEIFSNLKKISQEYVTQIREVADCIAKLDVLSSLAVVSVENNYVRPEIDESGDFIVKNGRHPVLEKILPLGTYVANDLDIHSNSSDKTQFMILTGPNMAGKSTYMRQNALIVILAQTGSRVPADYVKLGLVDRIFTRVGASDDLTLGQSTFMVEMIETANIINSATEKSFILLDEIGRGTSTYDGVAIAWSVAEYIATKIKARCIFATHYHELNVMTKTYPQIKNYRITISEENGEIEFLRKIVQGGASKSYGIQVAKMAGLPNSVVKRSQELMQKMQKDFSNDLSSRKKTEVYVPQLNLFEK